MNQSTVAQNFVPMIEIATAAIAEALLIRRALALLHLLV